MRLVRPARAFWCVVLLALAAGILLVANRLTLVAYCSLLALMALAAIMPMLSNVLFAGRVLTFVIVSTVVAPLVSGAQFLSIGLVLLACAGWGLELITTRRATLFGAPVVRMLLCFMGAAVLSFVVGQYPWYPTSPAPMRAQIGGLALFLASGGLFLVMSHQVRSVAHLRRLTWIFVALGGLFVAQQLVTAAPIVRLNQVTQPDTVGSLFWTWLVAVAASQAAFNVELTWVKRLGLVAVVGLTVYRCVFVASDWVSGWMPPIIALAIILTVRFPRLAVSSAALALAPAVDRLATGMELLWRTESYSWSTRLEAARLMAQILERNPWLGYGPANYYNYTELFPIFGWWVRFNSHNNYLDIVAQTGIIGLALFVCFAMAMAAEAWRLRRVANGFGRAYAIGALAGLVASLVAGALADWIVPFAYNVGLKGFRSSLLFWFFLGGATALTRLTRARTATGIHPQHSGAAARAVLS